MTSYKLVMPGDLNQYGFLFGGKMLMWVDEVAWMAVSGDYPGCNFVTVGMSEAAEACLCAWRQAHSSISRLEKPFMPDSIGTMVPSMNSTRSKIRGLNVPVTPTATFRSLFT